MPANALLQEKSPYLRQHAYNPVAWLPWGEAAFTRAKREDKPIFLSVGYSTCHWCHVMAHESFENEGVADVLNRFFIPVKVDREERPDVDRIYMLFVQATTGSGGWPMSVWLTPDRKPFFGGTYFPPDARYGRPGFRELLEHIAQLWKNDRARIELSSTGVTEQLQSLGSGKTTVQQPDREVFDAGFWQFRRMFDRQWGGFGSAPKFPRPVVLNYLLRYFALDGNEEALEMVTHTLRMMAAGGMHDHLGGGFHRYSVDERWFVPHFEKMLYDQAQLAISFLEAFQITGDEYFAEVARGIFHYVGRDLTSPEGAFYSAEDADSPDPENTSHSREGAFYVWRKSEIDKLLGSDADRFSKYYGVEADGNMEQDPQREFTGRNILYAREGPEDRAGNLQLRADLAFARERLLAARSQRPRPHLDSKILTSWNGLMISALVKGYRVLGDICFLEMAERSFSFVSSAMYNRDSCRLLRRYCDGEAGISAFLDDYAFLVGGALDLFEATGKAGFLEFADQLATHGLARFEDVEDGGFYGTESDASDLLLRVKDDYDGAEPSGNSVATEVLLRLSHLTGNERYGKQADRSLAAFAAKLKSQPTMAPQMAVALGRWLAPPEQVIIRIETVADKDPVTRDYDRKFAPYTAAIAVPDSEAEAIAHSAPAFGPLRRQGRITVYECRNFVCNLPKFIN